MSARICDLESEFRMSVSSTKLSAVLRVFPKGTVSLKAMTDGRGIMMFGAGATAMVCAMHRPEFNVL